MKKNIGFVDTFIRVVFAVAVFMLTVTGFLTGMTAVILNIAGVIALSTSMAGVCLIYLPFGMSSRGNKEA